MQCIACSLNEAVAAAPYGKLELCTDCLLELHMHLEKATQAWFEGVTNNKDPAFPDDANAPIAEATASDVVTQVRERMAKAFERPVMSVSGAVAEQVMEQLQKTLSDSNYMQPVITVDVRDVDANGNPFNRQVSVDGNVDPHVFPALNFKGRESDGHAGLPALPTPEAPKPFARPGPEPTNRKPYAKPVIRERFECQACAGSGRHPWRSPDGGFPPCPECKGLGYV